MKLTCLCFSKSVFVLLVMAVALFCLPLGALAHPVDKADVVTKIKTKSTSAVPAEAKAEVAKINLNLNVKGIVRRGWMTPFEDGEFHAERPVSRTQLAVVLVKVFDVAKRKLVHLEAVVFDDVTPSHIHYRSIQLMVQNDLMTGYRKKQFYPSQKVDRAEGFAIVANAYGVFQFNQQQVDEILAEYKDGAQAPAWSRKALATALDADYINVVVDSEGNKLIKPSAMMTRGDLAFALTQYLSRIEDPHSSKGL